MKTVARVREALSDHQLFTIEDRSRLPLLIVLTGILFTLFLQVGIQDGVFYSGDGGLKALLTHQLASGNFRFDLNLSAADWARNVWEKDGLYPFTPPYVYNRLGHYYITFPFTFPLVTAPFQALLGYRGLYIIPIVSTWALWFKVYSVCRRLKIRQSVTAIALIILIFASPLSLYSGMYWEHTLAILLAFWGLADLLFPVSEKLSVKEAVSSGVLIGLSVWFRPEFLCLAGIVLMLAGLGKLKLLRLVDPVPHQAILFSVSLLITLAVFFSLNKLIYGHPLGIHALQVVEHFSISDRILVAVNNFKQLTTLLIYYFPIALVPVFLLLFSFNKKLETASQVPLLCLISVLFLVAVPLIVPTGAGGKQWGARFLLILIPIVSVLLALQLTAIRKFTGQRVKYAGLVALGILVAVSLHINVYTGPIELGKTYQAITPVISVLRQNSNTLIAMSHQFVAQALMPPLSEKTFFRTETVDDVKVLSAVAVEQGYQSFLYVCYPHRPCTTPQETPDQLKILVAGQPFQIRFSSLGTFGKYPVYEVSILNS